MIARFFVERPVLANVLALVTLLVGGVALCRLPIAQYPNVVPPTVQVTTRFPGASARTVMDAVALPIEQQVNGVQGMLYMQSTSADDGSYALVVSFAIGTNPDLAQVLVQNRVAAALAALPQAVQSQGVTVQKKSTAILQIVTLLSDDPRQDGLFLSNYATIALKDELARLPGVGSVAIFGAGAYAMRVWIDPDRLRARGLVAQDVVQAIQQQNQPVSSGQLGAPPAAGDTAFQVTLNVAGRLDQAAQFEDIVVKADANGALVRLRDVGRVELGAQSYAQSFALDGRPAAGIAISQTPEANALDVAAAVRARMAVLAAHFPPGVRYAVPFDTTVFVQASIREVYQTLLEAAALVLLVILAFVQDWRAMLVPATTVPVTIVGAFAAMAALGFTVNLATLFAVVLAVGIVVDDAIVVVEGAASNIERGLAPRDAAIEAMRRLLGPIVGITLVLISVFLPASFLPGLTGRMYAQFALVIAATALLSAINAATLKPTQCALWLRPSVPPAQRNAVYRGINAAYAALERGYTALVRWLVRHHRAATLVALLVVAANLAVFARLPTSFIPVEDQGYVLISVQLADGAALGRTEAMLDRVGRLARAVPGVSQTLAVGGVSALDGNATLSSAGLVYVMLKDWSVRGRGQGLRAIYDALTAALADVDAQILVIPPPPIQGIGNAGGFTMQVELRDGSLDLRKLQAATQAIVQAAAAQPSLQRVATSVRAGVPQLDVAVDRLKAETLRVSPGDAFQALATDLGSAYAGQVSLFGRVFQVSVQADARFRQHPADLSRLAVRNAAGQMVPLGTVLRLTPVAGPALVSLYDLYPSATIIGLPAAGTSSGDALRLMDSIAARTLPPGLAAEWTAMSYQERATGNQASVALGLALLLVYLVLAGQYESWRMPLAVILSVPLALAGPAIALSALGLANNLYTQIGLLLLIALSAKNAILVVEVAREAMLGGMSAGEAAVAGARARLRPILMTSLAFILGVLPLLLASGAGASARASIGLTAASGMLASTCLAILFVPCLFTTLAPGAPARRVPPP